MKRYGFLCTATQIIALTVGGVCFAAQTAYTDEAAFLNAATAMGYHLITEGFEDETPWGSVRTTITGGTHTAPSVTSQQLTWLPNNTLSQLTTAPGPARTGNWGFYQLPHGDWVNDINDGLVVTAPFPLYAAGGWLVTNTPFAAVDIILDNDTAHPVDFNEGDNVLSTAHRFLGVIDTAGFTRFEMIETEGQLGDFKFIFADDFTFAERLPGDFNTDSQVEQVDLTLLLSAWGDTTVPAEWTAPFDGLVDQSELNDLLANWGVGIVVGPGSLEPQNLPEPATLWIVAATCWIGAGRTRRVRQRP